jgi:chromosome segregation ATPase
MKYLPFYLFALLLLLTGCGQKTDNTKDLALAHKRDSLESIIQQKDNEINDIMGTMNDIEAGFRAINEAEQRVSVARQVEGTSSSERIRENMRYIQQAMQQNRELINKLRNQVRQGNVHSEQLRRTVDNLARQMEEKDTQIRHLQAELQAKDVQIGELTEQVNDLSNNVSTLREETTQKSQTISTQDKQLNTAWFVYGTKSELKEQKILQDGKVLQSNFNREYFTKIDIRVDKEIRLYSRSAKLLTSHPASSYTLEQDAQKQYVLRIQNPQLFWSTSKYLVVLVK